jgi:hypothetical protein
MTGLIVAVTILGTSFVAYAIYSFIRMYQMTRNMDAIAQCFLTIVTHPEDVDIIEDYSTNGTTSKCMKSDWNFPNTEGGFQ